MTFIFTPGNCYGVVGIMVLEKKYISKILSGEIEPNTGDVSIREKCSLECLCLKQDHFQYDDCGCNSNSNHG